MWIKFIDRDGKTMIINTANIDWLGTPGEGSEFKISALRANGVNDEHFALTKENLSQLQANFIIILVS